MYNTRYRSFRALLRSRGSSAGNISITNQLLHGPHQLVLCVLDQLAQSSPVQDPTAVAGMLHSHKGREEDLPQQSPAAGTGAAAQPALPLGEGSRYFAREA